MGLLCINCGSTVNALFIQYSPGNIRLTKCPKCNAVADEYIECEMMIVLIDLILHKPKAYRHLFFNLPHLSKFDMQGLVWKAALIFLLLDACRQMVLKPNELHPKFCRSHVSCLIAVGKIMINIIFSNLLFFSLLYFAVKSFKNKQTTSEIRFRDVFTTVLFSSYFKIFNIAMMVWDFPVLTVFIADVFLMSSNAVALKVIINITTLQSIGASLVSHIAKLLTHHINNRF